MAKKKTKAPSRTHSPARSTSGELHPRPMLRRRRWEPLDGTWDFVLDAEARFDTASAVRWGRGSITVPFAPETPASGVEAQGYFHRCWYRRTFTSPKLAKGDRLILHFGAVDYLARVWVNGRLVAEHEGGYTPFHADVTDALATGEQEVIVQVDDDPHDLEKPRGKQDWLPEAHSIWYPRTTGIWQSVWLEPVPAARISTLRWTPDLTAGQIHLEARLEGALPAEGQKLAVTLSYDGRNLCDDLCSVPTGGQGLGSAVRRSFTVAPAAAEDFAVDLLWTPEHPRLIDAVVRLLDADRKEIDRVESYTALRSVAVDGDRFLLNRRPRTLKLVLNQGYWPEGGMTPPDDDAFRRDVELVKQLGFDGVRMHQKIESPRFLYWADRLGLLVWEEMPSPYTYSPLAARRTVEQWGRAIERDASHPCIVAWVPVNESWGAPDLPTDPQQRAFVAAMYHMTRALDPTRSVIGNDGWEIEHSDITALHDYDADPQRLARRYAISTEQELLDVLKRERPGHRRLVLDDYRPHERPVMLTEFGGIAFSERAGDWGYSRAGSPEEFVQRYTDLLAAVRSLPKLAGWCYTQFTDTYQEANGLLYMDRSFKGAPDALREAVTG